ncbi:MAG: F0F1 ATP synthase subunit delta [Pseudomonadales bacterium]|nr:F0F1 ATP synthase subunit delta [Pseudomonadales bacterium]
MAELTTLARPYAKAVFGFALANQDLEAWSKMLGTLAAVSQDSAVAEVLASPALTSEQLVATLATVCGDELNEAAKNFVVVLADNKRIPLLAAIAQQYEVLKAKQLEMCDVEITSAFEIDSELSDKLAKALTNKLNLKVNIHTQVDETLIGGAVIRAGDLVIDSSVKARLAKLNEAMTS